MSRVLRVKKNKLPIVRCETISIFFICISKMWRHCAASFSKCGFLLMLVVAASGEKCGGMKQLERLADFQEKFLLSPGYPNNYEVNDVCSWTISREPSIGGWDFVVQLATIDIDLNDYNNNCSTDFLVAYEGNGTSGPTLAKWCGHERKIVKATPPVTLKFQSDDRFTGKGFAVSYSLVKAVQNGCEAGQKGRIRVGEAPVYEYFKGKTSVASCEWHIESEQPNRRLVFDLIKPSNISCGDGLFSFYDGDDTQSHVSLQYCSNSQPFSSMYLKSHKAVLVYNSSNLNLDPDGLLLKISTRPVAYDCTVAYMPTVEVKGDPVMLSLPHALRDRTPCPVRLWTPDKNKRLRLDVMGTDNREADCGTDSLEVKETGTGHYLDRSCNRGKNPVYRLLHGDSLTLTSSTRVFLRASAVDSFCNGQVVRKTSYDSVVQELTITPGKDYSSLGYCKYLITADKDMDVINLSLDVSSVVPRGLDRSVGRDRSCPGDFINVYDGDRETSSLLLSSCWAARYLNPVTSSQGQLLLVLDADANIQNDVSYKIKFYSVQGSHQCADPVEIAVTQEVKNLTSTNFPLNQICIYNLVAENTEEDIVVKVLEAELGEKCQSSLALYEGQYTPDMYGQTAVGRVCGQDSPTLRVHNSNATLVVVSGDKVAERRGFSLQVYTDVRSGTSAIGGIYVHLVALVVAGHVYIWWHW